MSESPDVAEFEAAREAYSADEGHDDAPAHIEADDSGDEPSEPAAKDWEKIAADREAKAASERVRRKTAEKARRELEERIAKLEASKPAIDPFEEFAARLREDDEDPIGDITSLKAAFRQMVAAQKAEREQENTQTQAQRHFQTIASTMSEAESDFSESHPDYLDAAKHYRTEREAELEALGYAGDTLQRQLAQDLIGVVQTAISQGRDPAETVYNLAKRRGFASGTKAAEDKLTKLAAGAAAGSRPAGGKPTGGGNLTPNSVSGLKGAAFDAAFQKLRSQERRAK